jgi:hypothetical protein
MALIRKLFWIAVFLLSTLCFIVLFEHGTEKFSENLGKQIQEFRKMVNEQIQPPKKEGQP